MLFTLRSLDGKPIEKLKKIRVFHGFKLQKMKLKGKIRLAPKEVTFKF